MYLENWVSIYNIGIFRIFATLYIFELHADLRFTMQWETALCGSNVGEKNFYHVCWNSSDFILKS